MTRIGKKKNYAPGFTLVEMIIAIGVFTVMMSVVGGAFASGAFSYRGSKELQKNVESAQYAMNTMAKHLRTSTIVFPDDQESHASEVRFYDYSSDRCFEYEIAHDVLQVRWAGIADLPVSDPDDVEELVDACDSGAGIAWTGWSDMTSGEVEGSFLVVPSDDGSGPAGYRRIGRVTTRLTVKNEESTNDHFTTFIQTSVSLRDYGYVGY